MQLQVQFMWLFGHLFDDVEFTTRHTHDHTHTTTTFGRFLKIFFFLEYYITQCTAGVLGDYVLHKLVFLTYLLTYH